MINSSNIRVKIAKYIRALQSQNQIPLWALANENVIRASALGVPPKWGKKTLILKKIIKLSYKLHISDCVIMIMGFYRAFSIYKKFGKNKSVNPKRLFFGHNASAEEFIYSHYFKKYGDSLQRINSITFEGANCLDRPSFLLVIKTILQNSYRLTAKLRKAPNEISNSILDYLIVAALNIGTYSFFRQFWKLANLKGLIEIIFLAPEVMSFAAIDEGIKTIYHQHGLVALSVLVPNFTFIEVLTNDEFNYFKIIKKNAVIKNNVLIRNINNKNDTLIFLPPHVTEHRNIHQAIDFLKWANKIGLQIIIRPPPFVDKQTLKILQECSQAEIDEINIPIESSLEKWKPKFVCSWRSTVLATSLDFGLIPISMCDPLTENPDYDMIYPLKYRALFWPRDGIILQKSMKNEIVFDDLVNKLIKFEDIEFLSLL